MPLLKVFGVLGDLKRALELAKSGYFFVKQKIGTDTENLQWTSRHRTTSGYSPLPFEGPHSSHAAFTISDTSSAFTQFLTKLTKSADSWLAKPPTYHLEVKTTAGGLLDEFNLSHGEFVRARRYRTPDYGFPTDVSVLVRVWYVNSFVSIFNVSRILGHSKRKFNLAKHLVIS
jgi:hypothetical protein